MGQTSPPGLAQPVLSHVTGTKVGDIGCGSGLYGYLMRVAWHFTGSWVHHRIAEPAWLVGVDFSPVAINRLKRFGIYDELLLADSSMLPIPDAGVDTALSMENLEHLFPKEVGPALRELARVARQRVVISTPAPWLAINHEWLREEIAEATNDPVPMDYEEFLVLAGCIHKSSVTPEQMQTLGFNVVSSRGWPEPVHGSLIYWAEVADLRFDREVNVAGIALNGYPSDDGRTDWRQEYVAFLRASQAIEVGHIKRPARRSPRVVAAVAKKHLRRRYPGRW
jgi:SAM-dependent methyltransferase